jgi:hypothetical protein
MPDAHVFACLWIMFLACKYASAFAASDAIPTRSAHEWDRAESAPQEHYWPTNL